MLRWGPWHGTEWRPSFERRGRGGFNGWPTEEGKRAGKSWLKEPQFWPRLGYLGQPVVVQDSWEAGRYLVDGRD